MSDYAGDWTRHFDDRFKIQLLADFIEKLPHESYRGLVDYIEHKHPYLMDRCEAAELLDQLYVTGQCRTLLSTNMSPSEFVLHITQWKKWLSAISEDKVAGRRVKKRKGTRHGVTEEPLRADLNRLLAELFEAISLPKGRSAHDQVVSQKDIDCYVTNNSFDELTFGYRLGEVLPCVFAKRND